MDTLRRTLILLYLAAAALCIVAGAKAAGGHYTIEGGTPAEQAQVTAALNASTFNWNLIPDTISVYVEPLQTGEHGIALKGEIWLDSSWLDYGLLSWGTVQHEMAHEVDYYLLSASDRTALTNLLGGVQWYPGSDGYRLAHDQYTVERFASTLAWAYWPNLSSNMNPVFIAAHESGHVSIPVFKAALVRLGVVPPTCRYVRVKRHHRIIRVRRCS